ncbi:MAG: CoA transferase, partial [Chloroflexi bacterium]|nr:CoA transferase [Chloroflexota bacterium]
LDDPRFAEGGRNAVGLGRFAPEVKPRWERAFANRTTEEVVALIRRHNGEAVPINDYDSLFGHRQVQALGLVEDHPASEGGLPRMLRVPWRFSWGQERAIRPSPALGEHTSSVLERAQKAGWR